MPRIATRCVCCQSETLDKKSAVLMPFVAKRAFDWDSCVIDAQWGLRDLPQGHAHALCNTLHCPRCGLVFLDMRFDDDEMSRLYADYRGPSYEALRESLEPGYRARNQRLVAGDPHIPEVEAFLQPWVAPAPVVLDWGGDTGLNTPLRQQARAHHVLEISGKPLVAGATALTEDQAARHRYDLVVLSNVLEHVPEPAALLARIAAVLGDAKLYVEVPFEALMRQAQADPQAWRGKRHWHEHINFFSEAALRELMHRHGLTVLDARQIEVPGSGGAVQLGLICQRG
jgi:hypothetical protein